MESPSYGKLVRRYRLDANLNQVELGVKCRLTGQEISNIERGVNTPWAQTADDIATALGLGPTERAELNTAYLTSRPPRSPRPRTGGTMDTENQRQPSTGLVPQGASPPPPPLSAAPEAHYDLDATLRRRVALPFGIVFLPSALAALGFLILVVALVTGKLDFSRPEVAARATIIPGGVWLGPQDESSFGGSLIFAARAYPSHPGDPKIAYVHFTAFWDGWHIVCTSSTPIIGDRYTCAWTPKRAGGHVSAGRIRISFDVYDVAGNHNNAPNGERTIYYTPHGAGT